MRSPGINGEGELRGNRLTQVHLEKWPLKWSVCVLKVMWNALMEVCGFRVLRVSKHGKLGDVNDSSTCVCVCVCMCKMWRNRLRWQCCPRNVTGCWWPCARTSLCLIRQTNSSLSWEVCRRLSPALADSPFDVIVLCYKLYAVSQLMAPSSAECWHHSGQELTQGSHASWKVLDFFLKISGPEKSWKITLVLESPGN